jgi:formylglycine-generating enzyme required for sulfatase activity
VWLKQVNDEWAKDKEQRENRLHAIQQLLGNSHAKTPAQWYVTGQGQTMVVIPGPVEFLMGSPVAEANRERGPDAKAEMQQPKRIRQTYAIAAKEVTLEQFRNFSKIHPYFKKLAPNSDYPMHLVTWYDATEYCNWLSLQEGIPKEQWCYVPAAGDKYDEGMKLAPDYLSRTGYRLPQEAEWEHACRAGALTSRYYGETEELLGRYARCLTTSPAPGMLPCGSLKPNDLGLFDMLGNAREWCQDGIMNLLQAGEDAEDKNDVKDTSGRALRGGSFLHFAGAVRSAHRTWDRPMNRSDDYGFRPARTLH